MSPVGTATSPAPTRSTRSSTSTSRRSAVRRGPTLRPTPGVFDHVRRLFARDPRGEGPRLPAGPVLVQRQRRPVRGLLRRRHDQDRDELPARRLRAVRGLPRRALQPRDPRGPLQGQDDRRGARHADRGGGRLLRGDPGDRAAPATLVDVGLGYVRLGQPAPTLSGRRGAAGEARVRAAEAVAPAAPLYVLDEPTTGLHFEDIRKLLGVLGRLVDAGNTVVVIEHNLDVIKTADWVIDMGPEGGSRGGSVIAEGTPEADRRQPRVATPVSTCARSWLGREVPVGKPQPELLETAPDPTPPAGAPGAERQEGGRGEVDHQQMPRPSPSPRGPLPLGARRRTAPLSGSRRRRSPNSRRPRSARAGSPDAPAL